MKLSKYSRLISRIRIVGDCWEWTGSCNRGGYGKFDSKEYAHRVMWEMLRSNIPNDLMVLHCCDNRRCVNIAHLFLGSHDDNMADMVRKGRSRVGVRHHNVKFTEQDIVSIRYWSRELSTGQLALLYNTSYKYIWSILKRHCWSHIGV